MKTLDNRSPTLAHFIEYVKNGDEDKLKSDFENYPNIKTPKNLSCLLKSALEAGSEAIVHVLLENGLNKNAALDIAIHSDSYNVINLLLDQAADVDEGLYFAVKANNIKIIALMLKRGANINTDRRNGNTPLHTAVIQKCESDVVAFLLKNGADCNARTKSNKIALNLAQHFLLGKNDLITKEKLERIVSILRENTLSDNVFECLQGLPDGLSGYSYQIKLFTLYAIINTKLDCQYELGTEVKDLLPFDDIYLRKTRNGRTHCHFVQVKQTKKPEFNKIKESNFFTVLKPRDNIKEYMKGNDTIVKLFKKFNEINEKHLGNEIIGEFIYCTNTNFHTDIIYCFTSVHNAKGDILCGVGREKWKIHSWRYLYLEIKFFLLNLIAASHYIEMADKEFRCRLNTHIEELDNLRIYEIVNENLKEVAMSSSVCTIAEEGLKAIDKYLKFLDNSKIKINSACDIDSVKSSFPSACELPCHTEELAMFASGAIVKINEIIKTVKNDKEFLSHFSKFDDAVIKIKIEHFVQYFSLYTDCPNSDELEDIITSEISEYFQIYSSKFVSYYCVQYFNKWISNFKNDRGHLFTHVHGKKLFHDLRELIFQFINKSYMQELELYNINFKRDNMKLSAFLNKNNTNKILHVITEHVRLHTLYVLQTLKSFKPQETHYNFPDSYLFTSSELIFKTNDNTENFIKAFSSSVGNDILVIECPEIPKKVDSSYYEFLYQLRNVMGTFNKRIIVIAKDDNIVADALKVTFKEYDAYNNPIGFADLSRETQEAILESIVNFQNDPRPKVCVTEIPLKDLLTLSSACKIIDEQLLSIIITNNNCIKIGDTAAFFSDEYNTAYYIPRFIHHQVIDSDVLTMIDKNLFFVTGISKNDLITKVHGRDDLINVWEEGKTVDVGIILLPDLDGNQNNNTSKESFARISNECCKNITWLEFREEFIFWKGKSTCIEDPNSVKIKLSKMDDEIIRKFSFPPENLHDGIVILANNPGEGKSTMLTGLAHEIKKKYQNTWIIRINLKDHLDNKVSSSLNRINFTDEETSKAVETITHMVVQGDDTNMDIQLERKLLEAALTERGKLEVVILFDGFDEISPSYKENTCILLKALIKSNIRQMYVTTRVHLKDYLEEQLQTPACMLASFTEFEQIRFLAGFWKWSFKFYNVSGERSADKNTISDIVKHVEMCYKNWLKNDYTDEIYGFEKIINNEFTCLLELREIIDSEFFDDIADPLIVSYKKLVPDKGNFLKVPLNLKMFAVNIFESKWQIVSANNIKLFDIYKQFVESNLMLYEQKKSRSETVNPAHKEQVVVASVSCREMHREVAVRQLFQLSSYLPDLNICSKYSNFHSILTRIGLAKLYYGDQVEFIHRSYAEFFFSEYLTIHMVDPNVQSTFFTNILVDDDYELVRIFFNDFLAETPLLQSDDANIRGTENVQRYRNMLIPDVTEKLKLKNNKSEQNCLHVAAHGGHTQIFLLISHNMTKNAYIDLLMKKSKIGYSVLHIAAENGHSEVYKTIIGSLKELPDKEKYLIMSCDVNGRTHLHLACMFGHTEMCTIILENVKEHHDIYETFITKQATNGSTALHFATKFRNGEILNLFIEINRDNPKCFIDLVTKCNDYGTPLHGATLGENIKNCENIIRTTKQHPDVFKYLITKCNNDEDTVLHLTASFGFTELSDMFIESVLEYPDVLKQLLAKCQNEKRSSLHIAALNGNRDMVTNILLASKQYPSVLEEILTGPDRDGRTSLHLAASNGHAKVCDIIIKTAVEYPDVFKTLVMKVDCDKKSALHLAARSGNRDTFKLILKVAEEHSEIFHDLIMKYDDNNETALHEAAILGHIEICNVILESVREHADIFKGLISKCGKFERTVLHMAAYNGNIDLCNIVMNTARECDIDIFIGLITKCDAHEETALHVAALRGHSQVCEIIIKATKQYTEVFKDLIIQRNKYNHNALRLAAWFGHTDVWNVIVENTKEYPEVLKLLLTSCAEMPTVLHAEAMSGHSDMCGVVVQSIKQYPDALKDIITKCDENEHTPLHRAAWKGHRTFCEVIMKYVEEYPDIFKSLTLKLDKNHQTALHLAARNGHKEVCDAIITITKKYPDLFKDIIKECDVRKHTVLHIAALNGHRAVCDIIMKYTEEYLNVFGELITAIDDNHHTALHLATWNGHGEICDAIMKTAKDYPDIFKDVTTKCDKSGSSVLHLAAKRGLVEVCDVIMKNSKDDIDVFKDLIMKCDINKQTALHIAAQNGSCRVCDVIMKTCKNNFDVFRDLMMKCDINGQTALHVAAQSGHGQVCDVIIQAVKDCPDLFLCLVTKYDKRNRNALNVALRYGHRNAIEIILEHTKDHTDIYDDLVSMYIRRGVVAVFAAIFYFI